MMCKKEFSIIIPSYNSASFIEESIISVQNQDHQYYELVVIDGGSNDGTLKIIKKYHSFIVHWLSEPDRGQSHAINKGLSWAKGNIINWLNSDDYYEPDALKVVAEHFHKETINCVAGKSRIFQENKTIMYSSGTDVYPESLSKSIGWARIDQPASFFSKEVWHRVGNLNEKLHYTMDREWWMRYLYIFGLGGIKKIDKVLANFRLHETSKTVSCSEKFQIEHDTIFYILSTVTKNRYISSLLLANLNIDLNLDSKIKEWTNPLLIQNSLNYYLLKRADEMYYQRELNRCKEFLKIITPDLLLPEDKKLYKKLSWRSKLPLSVISFYRDRIK